MIWSLVFICLEATCPSTIVLQDVTVHEESCRVLEAYYEYQYPEIDFICQPTTDEL